jgi:pimeloyl-ACP methyl ester carboxylesterase
VIAEDLVPNLLRHPRTLVRVAGLARTADLRYELEQVRDRGTPVTILWAERDGVIPRESFEALCVAAGVEGTVVTGTHSWLLADPEQFGEVITNDMRVAQLAREVIATPDLAPVERADTLRGRGPRARRRSRSRRA